LLGGVFPFALPVGVQHHLLESWLQFRTIAQIISKYFKYADECLQFIADLRLRRPVIAWNVDGAPRVAFPPARLIACGVGYAFVSDVVFARLLVLPRRPRFSPSDLIGEADRNHGTHRTHGREYGQAPPIPRSFPCGPCAPWSRIPALLARGSSPRLDGSAGTSALECGSCSPS
jgi:hypothetical protein